MLFLQQLYDFDPLTSGYYSFRAQTDYPHRVDLGTSYTVVPRGVAGLHPCEDTHRVIRAIEVSHTACKDEFRRNHRFYRSSVFIFSYYIPGLGMTCIIDINKGDKRKKPMSGCSWSWCAFKISNLKALKGGKMQMEVLVALQLL